MQERISKNNQNQKAIYKIAASNPSQRNGFDLIFPPQRSSSESDKEPLKVKTLNEPLLRKINDHEAIISPKKEQEGISQLQAAGLLLRSALPSLIQGIVANIAFTTLIYFISLKHNSGLIGAVGMGVTLYLTGIYAFLQALNIGLSALGSQAFGAKDPHLLGVYYKRALIIQLIVFFPLAAIISQISQVFKLVGFQVALADDVQKVLLVLLPAAIPWSYFDCTKNFLISQKIFAPQGYIQVVNVLLDIPLQYVLIVHYDMGILGVGLSRFYMESSRALAIYIYVRCSKRCQQSIISWERSCFEELWKQFKYQITAGSLQIIDILGSQIILLQAGYFMSEVVAANVIVFRVTKLLFIFTLSLTVALSSFVGNSMGEQNIKKVKAFIKMGIKLNCVSICCTWLLLGTLNRNIGRIFSDDEVVLDYVSGMLWFLMIITPFDTFQNIFGGVLRSVGKEKTFTKLCLFTYYPIAIPVSIVLSHYTSLEIYGLYAAMLIAKCMNTFGSIYLLWTMDTKEQIKLVVGRIKESHQSARTTA